MTKLDPDTLPLDDRVAYATVVASMAAADDVRFKTRGGATPGALSNAEAFRLGNERRDRGGSCPGRPSCIRSGLAVG